MAAISLTTHSNALSWIKMFKFRWKCHWSVYIRVQLTIFQHWFRKWLGAEQAASHYLNQWWHRLPTSLDINELESSSPALLRPSRYINPITIKSILDQDNFPHIFIYSPQPSPIHIHCLVGESVCNAVCYVFLDEAWLYSFGIEKSCMRLITKNIGINIQTPTSICLVYRGISCEITSF